MSEHIGLAQRGQSWEQLQQQLEAKKNHDVNWQGSRTGMYIWDAGDDVMQVGKDAYRIYSTENALGAGLAFPSLKAMEEEILGFGLNLLNAPPGAVGNMTSGGSESILMAMLSCRNHAASQGQDTAKSNIVIPGTAHPAFDKAAGYLCLEVRRVPAGSSGHADVAAMEQVIDDNTIMLVGSAPCYPYGLIDPIDQLSDLALKRNIWLHVDACVGGYFIPFAIMAGLDLEAFDFTLPGVRTISADLHKYGYCPKAASTILHRDGAQREHQIFNFDNWPAGGMSTPTAAGTRPGGAIAGAWAVLNYLGVEGYVERVHQVMAAREQFEQEVKEFSDIYLVNSPKMGVIAFHSATVNMHAVWGEMLGKGWALGVTTEPPAMHMVIQPAHLEVMDVLISDLQVSFEKVVTDQGVAEKVDARYN